MKSLKKIYRCFVVINYVLLFTWISQIVFFAIFNSSEWYKTNMNPEEFGDTFLTLILTNVAFYFYFQQGVKKLLDTGLFTKENAKNLKYAGLGLIAFWIINVISEAYSKGISLTIFSENKYMIVGYTIIGLIFIIMSAILEDGFQLKEDNDLTI